MQEANQGVATERATASAPAGGSAAALPCLLLTTAPGSEKVIAKTSEKPLGSRTAIARKADTLRRNLQDLIDRVGIERIGFMTLTFARNIRSRKLAEKRFHSFATHVLPSLVSEYIAVPEDKGMRSVRYSLKIRRHHQSFHFAAGGNAKWRAGCKALGALLGIQYEDCRAKFGPHWPHHMAPWIFLCYDHLEACSAYAETLPSDIGWRERFLAVRLFLGQLKGKQP